VQAGTLYTSPQLDRSSAFNEASFWFAHFTILQLQLMCHSDAHTIVCFTLCRVSRHWRHELSFLGQCVYCYVDIHGVLFTRSHDLLRLTGERIAQLNGLPVIRWMIPYSSMLRQPIGSFTSHQQHVEEQCTRDRGRGCISR
jgi:hypothetical protein